MCCCSGPDNNPVLYAETKAKLTTIQFNTAIITTTTTTATTYYYYYDHHPHHHHHHYLTTFINGCFLSMWTLDEPISFSLSTCSGKEPLRINVFKGQMSFLSSNHQCKIIEGNTNH